MKRAIHSLAAAGQPLLLLAVLTLAACTGMSPPQSRSADAERLATQAEAEERRGNAQAAAALYAEAAAAVTGTRRAALALAAARLEIGLGNLGTAASLLTGARTAGDPEQQQVANVLLARIEVLQARPQQALELLNALREPIPVPVLREAAVVRGAALFRLERHAEAIRVLTEREVWLDDAAAIIANQRLIWEGLQQYRGPAAPQPTGDPIIDGWLALAPVANRALSPDELRRALLDWRATYPDHPGARGLLGEMLASQRVAGAVARQIALLLPVSSPQRNFAIAVRDGFLAAHLRSPAAARVTVRIYDTALLGTLEAYARAQREGAEFVVGPLLRPDVEAVLPQAGFVPTLALNFSQSDTALVPSFFQFALYPEHEAQAVARYAAANGARTAIALVASNDVGYRQLNAFRTEFERLGGQILDWTGYDPNVQDFSAPITSILNITRSNQRYQRLAANLRVPLEFEPRRRQDVDMIFLAADARAGRLLAPQLRFHFAGDIPTYATSEIYEPGDPARDNDLNGVIFTDGPWLLAPETDATGVARALASYWPRASGSLLRFYGMGFDAYQLVGALGDPERVAWPLRGVTGDLVLDTDGRVNRLLPLGQFRAGRPVALGDAPPIPLASPPSEELASFR